MDEPSHYVVRGTAQAREIVLVYTADSISTSTFSNNVIDVESNRITADYAYVNPVSLFGFVPARASEPVRLSVARPKGWMAATVLATDDQGRFLAPSYLRLEDSPLFFSPSLITETFEVDKKVHSVTVHGRSPADAAAISKGCERIVTAAAQWMRGLPYDRYHFLFGFVPEGGGSGLEHSFSTLILVNEKLPIGEDSESFWGITTHEFFHLWCAERIHVQEIQHPDLTQPLETGTIWVNEGITEYASKHILLAAGFLEPEQVLQSYLTTRIPPGALPKQSWTDVSRAAPGWRDMNDLMIFAARMYMVGPPTIFALDMTMRRATNGERGVHDLLRYLLEHYAAKDRGFGEDELDDVLAAVAGPPAVEFYERFIDGDEIPDAAQYLDVLGYRYDPDGGLSELPDVTPLQRQTRRDYFSVTGEP